MREQERESKTERARAREREGKRGRDYMLQPFNKFDHIMKKTKVVPRPPQAKTKLKTACDAAKAYCGSTSHNKAENLHVLQRNTW